MSVQRSETLIEALNKDPLLAVRPHGLGRTAALTTDLNLWAGHFGNWDQLPKFLGTIVRWLHTTPEEFTVQVDQEKNKLHVVVDAVKNGAYVNNRPLTLRYLGVENPLEQTGPGRYEGSVLASETSGTMLIADVNNIVARTPVSYLPREFDQTVAKNTLFTLAERTGGDIYDDLSKYSPYSSSSSVHLWPYLALTTLLIFLLELMLRRFGSISPVNW